MLRKLQTASTLSPADWVLLFKAWLLLLVVELGLRTLSFRRVQSLLILKHSKAKVKPWEDVFVKIQRINWLVDKAGRHHLVSMSCLRLALVLQRLLGSYGIDTDLRIGVQKNDSEPLAHAWLEYQSNPIFSGLVSLTDSYIPFPRWEVKQQ